MASTVEKTEKKTQKDILRQLAILGGKMRDDDDITFKGDKLIVPASMTLGSLEKFIVRKRRELETHTDFSRTFSYRPWDGAYCMYKAFKRTFGAVSHQGTPGSFFFPGDPPRMISVPNGVDSNEQVPWGNFGLPGLDDTLFQTEQTEHPEMGPLFMMVASGPKKYAAEIEGVFELVENELKTNSMYRGKAFDGQAMPEFIDLSVVDRQAVVYSKEVLRSLEVNVWSQLRHTAEFEARGIPLKRAVLLHGPYGTGKTLAALLTGQEATRNGWTFIQGRPGRDNLSFVMQTARLYQPAVVFYEDVDQLADGAVVDESGITRLLDDFDGIGAKGTKLLCVLTTNHPKRLHAGMARPGRLDAMIEINELDLDGVTALVKCRVGDDLAQSIDWEAVYAAATGYKPAFVTEFADRTIRYALDRVLREGGDTTGIKLTTEDLVSSASDMRPQYDLMSGAKDRHHKPELEVALSHTIERTLQSTLDERVLAETNGDS